MENQTNYPPQQPQGNSSGANTVLLVIIILILAGLGYWWYTQQYKAAPVDNNPTINVDVNLPANNSSDSNTNTTIP